MFKAQERQWSRRETLRGGKFDQAKRGPAGARESLAARTLWGEVQHPLETKLDRSIWNSGDHAQM